MPKKKQPETSANYVNETKKNTVLNNPYSSIFILLNHPK